MNTDVSRSFESVRRATAGDADEFGKLVDQYSGLVTGVAYSVLGDFSCSEDVGQEAFLSAWKQRQELRDPSMFASWVCAIARNQAVDMLRKSRRTTEAVASLEDCEPVDLTDSETLEESKSRQAVVWKSLDSLPDVYRESMVLFYRSERSVADVATSLGESEATIRKRLERGRKLLRTEVESLIEDTLKGTAPKAVFTAGVLAGLAGTSEAASSVASISSAKALTAKSTGTAAGSIFGGLTGGVMGVLGGLIGGAAGTYAAYHATPYQRQRRQLLWCSALCVVELMIFLLLLDWLVHRQSMPARLGGSDYAIRLTALIVGFQVMLLTTIGGGLWLMRRTGREAEADGEPVEPSFRKRWDATASKSFTSQAQFWGLPLFEYFSAGFDDTGKPVGHRWAKAWIAIGDKAVSPLFAVGGVAVAPIACGGLSVGLLSVGGLAVGGVALAGFAVGAFALGGGAVGLLAIGGGAVGFYASGGLALGVDAFGGAAFGLRHVYGGNAIASGGPPPELEWLRQMTDSILPWSKITTLWPLILLFVIVQIVTVRYCERAGSATADDNQSRPVS